MKITFVSSRPSLSGGARVIAIYADRLQARGHDVTVVAPRIEQPRLPAKIRALARGRRLRDYPTRSHYDRLQARFVLADHFGPVRADDVPEADAVIATWWETAYTVAQMPPDRGRKFYFVQHHETHNAPNSHIRAGSYHLPLRQIVVADWLADVMQTTYGAPRPAVVPNSVDLEFFDAPARGKQPVPTVALMYAPTPFKGLDTSLAALKQVKARMPDLKVRAFGLKPEQRDLPLPSGAEFTLRPPQPAIRDLYAQSDLYLFGSRSEGFGLPILEAMACRTPVVATAAGCAPDVIADGRSGHVVPIDDADALADRMMRVLQMDDAGWRGMSSAAREAVAGYSWDDATTRFERALMEGGA